MAGRSEEDTDPRRIVLSEWDYEPLILESQLNLGRNAEIVASC